MDQAGHGFVYVDLGEHRLKDIDDPVSIFQLGEGSHPPLRTISNTNLPRPASSFLGRQREGVASEVDHGRSSVRGINGWYRKTKEAVNRDGLF